MTEDVDEKEHKYNSCLTFLVDIISNWMKHTYQVIMSSVNHPQIINPYLIKDLGKAYCNENCAKNGASKNPINGTVGGKNLIVRET